MELFFLVIFSVFLLFLALTIYFFKTWQNGRRKEEFFVGKGVEIPHFPDRQATSHEERATQTSNQGNDRSLFSSGLKEHTYLWETLVLATNNFHGDNKLGEGSFGAVYKGTLQNGEVVAIKKLTPSSKLDKDFTNEVELLSKVQHRNLVTLLGCCKEGDQRALVYEFMQNSSLDKVLFDPQKRRQLDWQKRQEIIIGIGKGLQYLHEGSKPRIIHRDIKASNILLDEKFNVKIADFGFAKTFPEDRSWTRSTVVGTFGYMAPEYSMSGDISIKTDIYSFGVLSLEIISGERCQDKNLQGELNLLLKRAWNLYKEKNEWDIVDEAIKENCDHDQVKKFIHVALSCTQRDFALRPEMSTVMVWLSGSEGSFKQPSIDQCPLTFGFSPQEVPKSHA